MSIKYTNIDSFIDRIMRHPLMQDTHEESVISYIVEFIGITGVPENYLEKTEVLRVEDYRAKLPCDFINIIQAMPDKGTAMVESSDTFFTDKDRNKKHKTSLPQGGSYRSSYKIQGDYIMFSFEKGDVHMSYKAIPTDDNGLPAIPDDQNFMMALEWYIKVRVFTILVDLGKLPMSALQNAEQQYCWYVGKYQSSHKMDTLGKMEKFTNTFGTLLLRRNEFKNGFRTTAESENFKIHR